MSEPVTSPAPARFPSWQSEVQAAINEADQQRLLNRVHAAEVAIFTRLQEIGKAGPHDAERESLADAVEKLRLLKRDRLGFPDWSRK